MRQIQHVKVAAEAALTAALQIIQTIQTIQNSHPPRTGLSGVGSRNHEAPAGHSRRPSS